LYYFSKLLAFFYSCSFTTTILYRSLTSFTRFGDLLRKSLHTPYIYGGIFVLLVHNHSITTPIPTTIINISLPQTL